jgi:hypothetical protein
MTTRNRSYRARSSRFGRAGRLGAIVTALALFATFGAPSISWASKPTTRSVTTSVTTKVVYAFAISPSSVGLIPAPGTTPGTVSEGDESIINDQLTSDHLSGHGASSGYPIIGYDSGTCIYTRVSPDGQSGGSPFNNTLEHCAATAVLSNGSIAAQGIITTESGTPQPATLVITGGTGRFVGVHGTIMVTFGAHYQGQEFETFTITLQ